MISELDLAIELPAVTINLPANTLIFCAGCGNPWPPLSLECPNCEMEITDGERI